MVQPSQEMIVELLAREVEPYFYFERKKIDGLVLGLKDHFSGNNTFNASNFREQAALNFFISLSGGRDINRLLEIFENSRDCLKSFLDGDPRIARNSSSGSRPELYNTVLRHILLLFDPGCRKEIDGLLADFIICSIGDDLDRIIKLFYLLYSIKYGDADIMMQYLGYFKSMAARRSGSFKKLVRLTGNKDSAKKMALIYIEAVSALDYNSMVDAPKLKMISDEFDYSYGDFDDATALVKDILNEFVNMRRIPVTEALDLAIKTMKLFDVKNRDNFIEIYSLTRYIRSGEDISRLKWLQDSFAVNISRICKNLIALLEEFNYRDLESFVKSPLMIKVSEIGMLSRYLFVRAKQCDDAVWSSIAAVIKMMVREIKTLQDNEIHRIFDFLYANYSEDILDSLKKNISAAGLFYSKVIPFIEIIQNEACAGIIVSLIKLINDSGKLEMIIRNYQTYRSYGVIRPGPNSIEIMERYFKRQKKICGRIIECPVTALLAINLDDESLGRVLNEFNMVYDSILYSKAPPACANPRLIAAAENKILASMKSGLKCSSSYRHKFPPLRVQSDIYTIRMPAAAGSAQNMAGGRLPAGAHRLVNILKPAAPDKNLNIIGAVKEVAAIRLKITELLDRLPEKARMIQSDYLSSIIFLESALKKRAIGEIKDDGAVFIPLLLLAIAKTGKEECQTAAVRMMREKFKQEGRYGKILLELNSFEADCDFMNAEALEMITKFCGPFLLEIIESVFARFAGKESKLFRIIKTFLPADKRCRGIINNEKIDAKEKVKKLAAHLVEEFQRLFSIGEIIENLPDANKKRENFTQIDLVPSRTHLDMNLGAAGGTCVHDGSRLIYNENFICVRMIYTRKHLWGGVIHFFTSSLAGRRTLVIAGCEPRLEISGEVDNALLWKEIKKYAVYLAEKLGCESVLQTINGTALSNRHELSAIIAGDIEKRPKVRVDGILQIGNSDVSDCALLEYVKKIR